MRPFGEISEVVTMRVSLPLKRNIVVGFFPASVLQQSDTPLYHIEDIEWDKEKLTLLGSMDFFVINDISVKPVDISRPECSEEIQANPLGHELTFYNHRHHSDKCVAEIGSITE